MCIHSPIRIFHIHIFCRSRILRYIHLHFKKMISKFLDHVGSHQQSLLRSMKNWTRRIFLFHRIYRSNTILYSNRRLWTFQFHSRVLLTWQMFPGNIIFMKIWALRSHLFYPISIIHYRLHWCWLQSTFLFHS